MTIPADLQNTASGLAALSTCESLILAMGELKIITETDALGVISDAADSHRGVKSTPDDKALHTAVTAILDRIIPGGNSVHRP